MIRNKTIKTGAGPVEVRKLALYDYAEFIRALRKLPKEFAQLFKSEKNIGDMGVLFEELPEIIADSWDDLVAIIAVGTDKDAEFMKSPDLDGADALEIIDGLLELNDYERISKTVKKMMARRQAQTQAQAPDNKTPDNKANSSKQ